MIDPNIDWIEIHDVPPAWADLVANQVELGWLTRYPLPSKAIVGRGTEFLVKVIEMTINDCGITENQLPLGNPKQIQY